MRVLLLRSRSLVWREVSADWLLAGDLTAGKLVEQAAAAQAASTTWAPDSPLEEVSRTCHTSCVPKGKEKRKQNAFDAELISGNSGVGCESRPPERPVEYTNVRNDGSSGQCSWSDSAPPASVTTLHHSQVPTGKSDSRKW